MSVVALLAPAKPAQTVVDAVKRARSNCCELYQVREYRIVYYSDSVAQDAMRGSYVNRDGETAVTQDKDRN